MIGRKITIDNDVMKYIRTPMFRPRKNIVIRMKTPCVVELESSRIVSRGPDYIRAAADTKQTTA